MSPANLFTVTLYTKWSRSALDEVLRYMIMMSALFTLVTCLHKVILFNAAYFTIFNVHIYQPSPRIITILPNNIQKLQPN